MKAKDALHTGNSIKKFLKTIDLNNRFNCLNEESFVGNSVRESPKENQKKDLDNALIQMKPFYWLNQQNEH